VRCTVPVQMWPVSVSAGAGQRRSCRRLVAFSARGDARALRPRPARRCYPAVPGYCEGICPLQYPALVATSLCANGRIAAQKMAAASRRRCATINDFSRFLFGAEPLLKQICFTRAFTANVPLCHYRRRLRPHRYSSTHIGTRSTHRGCSHGPPFNTVLSRCGRRRRRRRRRRRCRAGQPRAGAALQALSADFRDISEFLGIISGL
jgi:hypothetical protein